MKSPATLPGVRAFTLDLKKQEVMTKYLDKDGVATMWGKCKDRFATRYTVIDLTGRSITFLPSSEVNFVDAVHGATTALYMIEVPGPSTPGKPTKKKYHFALKSRLAGAAGGKTNVADLLGSKAEFVEALNSSIIGDLGNYEAVENLLDELFPGDDMNMPQGVVYKVSTNGLVYYYALGLRYATLDEAVEAIGGQALPHEEPEIVREELDFASLDDIIQMEGVSGLKSVSVTKLFDLGEDQMLCLVETHATNPIMEYSLITDNNGLEMGIFGLPVQRTGSDGLQEYVRPLVVALPKAAPAMDLFLVTSKGS